MTSRYLTTVHGIMCGANGTEEAFVESTMVRLVSDSEAWLVLQNHPVPGSSILLDTVLLEDGDRRIQARIRGRVVELEGGEWRLAISPRSRLYSVSRSTIRDSVDPQ